MRGDKKEKYRVNICNGKAIWYRNCSYTRADWKSLCFNAKCNGAIPQINSIGAWEGNWIQKKYDENIFNEEIETRHAFIKILGKARTFIEEKFYEKYKNFQDKCALQEFYFLEKQLCNIPYEGDELNQCLKRSDEIRSIHEEVVLDIKEYLKKLKIMN